MSFGVVNKTVSIYRSKVVSIYRSGIARTVLVIKSWELIEDFGQKPPNWVKDWS